MADWAHRRDSSRPIHYEADRQLDVAQHQTELTPGPLVHLHTDHAVQGVGSAACGPGVLPQHRLELGTADFTLNLTPFHRP